MNQTLHTQKWLRVCGLPHHCGRIPTSAFSSRRNDVGRKPGSLGDDDWCSLWFVMSVNPDAQPHVPSSVFSRTCEGQNIKYRTCSNAVSSANSSLGNRCQESSSSGRCWNRPIKAGCDFKTYRGGTVKIWPMKIWLKLVGNKCDMIFQANCACPSIQCTDAGLDIQQIHLKKPTNPQPRVFENLDMLFFSFSGLSLGCRRLPCSAVLGSRRRTFPGSVPRVAAGVQWPGESLRSQVQSQGLGPCGGASSQSAGWDALLHRVLGHVYQRSVPGRSQSLRAHIGFFRLYKNFTVWELVAFLGF